ncbi:MAG TPA: MIP family channel protein [Candidatus Dormibacteraeota bacterium]|nr:MIP family channel protein [Candidatus Dormibacteraeota bacterium]
MYSKIQKLAAEFIGTFALVFFAAGSICTDQFLRTTGQGSLGLLGIAIASGLVIAVMYSALARISGGHFNPAITIGFWVTRRSNTFDAVLYWLAQLAGAVTAAYSLRALIPEETWRAVSLGTPDLARDFTRSYGILLEGLLTFFLVFIFFSTAVDEPSTSNKNPDLVIGLTVTMAILLGGPLTGAVMNPARALGPAIAARHWANHGVYWVGPLAGGVVAGWLYDALFLKKL